MAFRVTGIMVIAIGATGLMLGVYGGVKTWSIASQVGRVTDVTLGQFQVTMKSVHRQSEAAVSVVSATRERLDSVRIPIHNLSNADDPTQPPVASILDTLDQDFIRGLDATEGFVRTMQDNMRNASSALLLLDSVPVFSTRLNANIDQRQNQLRSLATSLTEISDLLEQMAQICVEIRSKSTIDPYQLERLQNALDRVDSRLVDFESEVRRFSDRIKKVEETLSELQRSAPEKIHKTAVLSTVFFFCFSCSQVSLLVQGCRLTRRRQSSSQ